MGLTGGIFCRHSDRFSWLIWCHSRRFFGTRSSDQSCGHRNNCIGFGRTFVTGRRIRGRWSWKELPWNKNPWLSVYNHRHGSVHDGIVGSTRFWTAFHPLMTPPFEKSCQPVFFRTDNWESVIWIIWTTRSSRLALAIWDRSLFKSCTVSVRSLTNT